MLPRIRLPVAACLPAVFVCLSPTPLWAGPETAQPAAANADADPGDRLSLEQQRIADSFQHLQDVLLRMAELSRVTDADRAALLRKAVRQSEEQLIGVQFDSLVELLKKDQLSRAIENQETLQNDLHTLLELLLSENRAERIESEKDRIRRYLKRLGRIIKQQKSVQGRTAGSGPTESLADEQHELAQETGDLARDIREDEQSSGGPPGDEASEDGEPAEKPAGQPEGQDGRKEQPGEPKQGEAKGSDPSQTPPGQQGGAEGEGQGKAEPSKQGPQEAPSPGQGQREGQRQGPSEPRDEPQNPARQSIEAARQRMEEARKKLEEAQREGAVEKQEEAIRELEQAKADLERILRQLREEEIERMLSLLETRVSKMLQMQREVYEGTVRLDKVPGPERTHTHEIEAARLGRKEAEIVLEADKALILLHDDGTAVAFPEALRQIRQDMRQVVQRLDRAQIGRITQTIEEEIIAALEEMIEALKQAQQEADEQRQMPPMMPGPPQDRPLVDVLSEIKMIRAMQMRVNRRTERYSKLVEGEQAEDPDLLEALDRLAERQERIYRITRDLEMGKNR